MVKDHYHVEIMPTELLLELREKLSSRLALIDRELENRKPQGDICENR